MVVLADLLERSDTIGNSALSGEEEGLSALAPKSVICFPGRGPLDVAVAAMMVHLLRRTGCTVRQEERDPLRRGSPAFADVQDVDAICILGLFDERALGRMVPFMQQINASRVLIGVRRGNASHGGEIAPAVDRPHPPTPRLPRHRTRRPAPPALPPGSRSPRAPIARSRPGGGRR